ncbi:hypothetical protein PSN45_000943 [Yamadazyma tenuis]|nr:hypothetical protein PSN45_000943 [Yamadazyma tenuis]
MHCTSAFVRRDLLQRHCRTVHSINLSSANFPKPVDKKPVDDGRSSSSNDDSSLSPSNSQPNPSHLTIQTVVAGEFDGSARPRSNSVASIGVASVTSATSGTKDENNDLVSLLSISKRLYQMLTQFDVDITKYTETELNEIFLIGYIELANTDRFPVLEEMLKKLLHHLNSNLSDTNNFKVVSVYTVLAVGFNVKNNMGSSMELFNKGWNLLTLKSIPMKDNNNNASNQMEILNNLFLLNYVFLEYNLDAPKQDAGHFANMNLNSDLLFNYLNDIASIILTNLLQEKDRVVVLKTHMNSFWSIYVLLSNYFVNSYPPKFYNVFLDQVVMKNQTLSQVMLDLSRTIRLIESSFVKEIITCTLINELNHLIHFNKLLIYDSKNSLHNSIILINKSVIDLSSNNKIFEIFKKKLIINCPIKFNDLLNHYIFQPSHKYEFNLLSVALKEFNYNHNYNYNFNFNLFILNNLKTDLFKFSNGLLPFFNTSVNEINNNLGIIGFPIIFNASFLNGKFGILNVHQSSDFDKRNLNLLIIEWYLTMFKILVNLQKNEALVNNYIIQCVLYLLNGNEQGFQINRADWFMDILKRLDGVYHDWLNFIDHKDYLVDFNANLNSFLNNFISSNLVDNDSNYTTLKTNLSTTSTLSNGSGLTGTQMYPALNYQMGHPIGGYKPFDSRSPDMNAGGLPQLSSVAASISNGSFKSVLLPNPEREKERELMLPPIKSPINKVTTVQPLVSDLHN